MAYKALYNKYRPQTFDQVVGQKTIVRTLRNALSSGKIAHAYLFAGPRGTGKTSMARLFAKALNCEEGLGHQCNHCSNCLGIVEGHHPDVVEIDAASNNGVDQVRDLVDKIRYAPIKGRYKVYIIDEIHMMSSGAFNALLKTLEEPPEDVVFIMATTEPYKVLPTILSRCQRFNFSKIDDAEIKANLIHVLGNEGISYEEAAVNAIVSLADGGMRDGLSIMEQVIAYSNDRLNEEDVLTVFGLTSNYQRIELLKLLSAKDVSGVLSKLNDFLSGGIDIKRLNSSLLDLLKDSLVYGRTRDALLLSASTESEAKEVASVIPSREANKMIGILLKAQADFKNVSNVRSLFELTLIRLCSIEEAPAPSPVPAYEAPRPAVMEVPTPAPAPIKKEAPKAEEVPVFASPKAEDVPSFITKEEPKPVEEPIEEPSITINADMVGERDISNEGESYSLDDDTLINIMVLGNGNREERRTLSKNWPQLENLKGHPTVGNLATLLSEGRPFCLCKDALILNFNFTRLSKKANIMANQSAIAAMVEQLVGRKVFVYALDRLDINRIYNKYTSLEQISKLPNKKDIELRLPKGE